MFTDEKLVMKARAFHLERLEVTTCKGLVVGLKLTWLMDLVNFTKEHNAKLEPDLAHTMEFEKDEYINFMQLSFNDAGISYMMLRTNQN